MACKATQVALQSTFWSARPGQRALSAGSRVEDQVVARGHFQRDSYVAIASVVRGRPDITAGANSQNTWLDAPFLVEVHRLVVSHNQYGRSRET